MRVVLLGPPRPAIEAFLASWGDEVSRVECRLEQAQEAIASADWLVSYGYRYMIRPDMLARFPNRIVNLHISLLPWNRGADPNMWSFLEDTPKGVSLHLMDEGLDTGPLLAQREVGYDPDDTLRTSYDRLSRAIEALFMEAWPAIRSGAIQAHPQPPGGSVHRLSEREALAPLLARGWDTPVKHLIGKAKR